MAADPGDSLDVTLHDIIDGLKSRYRLLVFILVVTLATITLLYKRKLSATATLVIKRDDASLISGLIGMKPGQAALSVPGVKSNTFFEKYLSALNSNEFFLMAARKLQESPDCQDIWTNLVHPFVSPKSFPVRILRSVIFTHSGDPNNPINQTEFVAKQLSKIAEFGSSGFDNVRIIVKHKDMNVAVRLVNKLAEFAEREIEEKELSEFNHLRIYMEHQLEETKARLAEIDKTLVDYRKSTDVVITDHAPQALMHRASALEEQIRNNLMRINQNNKLVQELTTELKRREKVITDESKLGWDSLEFVPLVRSELEQLRNKKSNLLALGYTQDSPTIRDLDDEISGVAQRLKRLLEASGTEAGEIDEGVFSGDLVTRIQSLKGTNDTLRRQNESVAKALEADSKPIRSLPAAIQRIVELNRASTMEIQVLAELRNKLFSLEMQKTAIKDRVRLLEPGSPARVPPEFTLLPRLIVGTIFGFILAIFAASLFEIKGGTIRNPRDLRKLGLTTLGIIPRRSRRKVDDWETPPDDAVLQVRALIRALDSKPKTIALCPPRNSVHVHSFSFELGRALARAGERVLVLDCDLRSSIKSIFQPKTDSLGMVDILSGQTTGPHKVLPNLEAVGPGSVRVQSDEVWLSASLAPFVEETSDRFDRVLYILPSLTSYPDSLHVLQYIDMPILVAEFRQSSDKDLLAASEVIRKISSVPIFGVIQNAFSPHSQDAPISSRLLSWGKMFFSNQKQARV